MRCLDSITDSVDVNLSKLQETAEERVRTLQALTPSITTLEVSTLYSLPLTDEKTEAQRCQGLA